jgi:hypothetical protein
MVVAHDECPRRSWITRGCVPSSTIRATDVWRSQWKWKPSSPAFESARCQVRRCQTDAWSRPPKGGRRTCERRRYSGWRPELRRPLCGVRRSPRRAARDSPAAADVYLDTRQSEARVGTASRMAPAGLLPTNTRSSNLAKSAGLSNCTKTEAVATLHAESQRIRFCPVQLGPA